ncbi:MAG: hypothetical protein ABI620_07350 [Chloroflexota bacterium]
MKSESSPKPGSPGWYRARNLESTLSPLHSAANVKVGPDGVAVGVGFGVRVGVGAGVGAKVGCGVGPKTVAVGVRVGVGAGVGCGVMIGPSVPNGVGAEVGPSAGGPSVGAGGPSVGAGGPSVGAGEMVVPVVGVTSAVAVGLVDGRGPVVSTMDSRETTVIVSDARILEVESRVVLDFATLAVFVAIAASLWGVRVAVVGTTIETAKVPRLLACALGMPVLAPSHVNWMEARADQLVPTTWSVAPGNGMPLTANFACAALALRYGVSSRGTRRRIGIVATTSVRRRAGRPAGRRRCSSIHSVPSQNMGV